MIAPTAEERASIRGFCRTWSSWQDRRAGLAATKKEVAAEKKSLRDRMHDFMSERGQTCFVVRHNEENRYLKTRTYSNSRALSEEIVREALDQVRPSSDDIGELVSSVVAKIQELRKTSKDYVAVVKTRPKSMEPADACPELADMASAYFEAEVQCEEAGRALKDLDDGIQVELGEFESDVGAYLRRANFSSQRVNMKRRLEGGGSAEESMFIRRRVSRRKSRMTVVILRNTVDNAICRAESSLRTRGYRGSIDAIAASIMEAVEALPMVESEKISLSRS